MKLLDWMHRKFRHNSGEPLKDFLIGQPSLDDQQYYHKQNSGAKGFKQALPEKIFRNSFAGLLEADAVEQGDYEEETAAEMSELFHGFLAIGTLGSEPGSIDPAATPTFTYSIEYITEKETEVTEDELKLINDELEKVLAAEAKDEWGNDSSGRNSYVSTGRNSYVSTGRNSYVSTGRSSHGSTITLSGKPLEGQETNGNGGSVCPLQEYLFGSAIEATEAPKVAKKEQRTSLGELFQRTKMTEDGYGMKAEKEERRAEKDSEKSATHLMKKLKKKVLPAASKSSTMSAGGDNYSSSAEKKLHKLMQMFHRKVHPEYSAVEKETGKNRAKESKKKTSDSGHDNGNHRLSEEDILIYPSRNSSKKSMHRFKNHFNPPHFTLADNESNENKELWIKTDADYLVLEL
ncbi:hypothetical protein SAY87_013394 [Trapa incisa]|uniref:LAZY1 n=1 Tax=Trapa incisa TaxID=236973 RepID=A0AAN7KH24_9MYRT|nr:hypothetical protein SAY87_013394 [Trapa incisa]